ncbi:ABC transporter substrate-binding protein [Paenibacillus alkalitolerans]|uniref:ABC transporter substrate-binding protein n=1 Tax=Paenibacillus alkalitolerans TaxID=2799335 RepID=UPI001F176C56|nr:sugar ABC transporter substrate-binding protein [Paenibacillus alkalitolerans]
MTSLPYAEMKLTVYALTHPWSDTIKSSLPSFEATTGIKVDFKLITEEQLAYKLAVQFLAGSETPDVFMYRPYMDKRSFHDSGWTTPLDPYIAGDEEFDFADFDRASMEAVTIGQHVTSIPIFTDQQVLYYRKDLLKSHGLAVPQTMDELLDAARQLHDPGNELYGFVARGQRNALVTPVSSFVFSQGGEFMTGRQVNTPEAVKGFHIYATLLREYGPPGVLSMSWPQASELFLQGKAAFFSDTSSIYNYSTRRDKSPIDQHIGFALFPAGDAGARPYNVTSWALAINSKSLNKAAAWEFIRWASSKESILKAHGNGVPGPRNSVWAHKDGMGSFPQDLAQVIQRTREIGISRNVPDVTDVAEARDVIGSIVVKAVLGEDIQAAADQANAELQAIIDRELSR